MKVTCWAERRGRVGPCPKNATRTYGGRALCKQHECIAEWDAWTAKRKASNAVALRLATLLDAYWFAEVEDTEAIAAVQAACRERARIETFPIERWAHGGAP